MSFTSTSYAGLTDLANVAQAAMFGASVTPTQQAAALLAASAEFDTCGLARYAYPIQQPYDPALVRDVCIVATYDLICFRGYNPQSGADKNYRDRALDVRKKWYEVKTQSSHYNIVEAVQPSPALPSPVIYSQPLVGYNPEHGQGGAGRRVS